RVGLGVERRLNLRGLDGLAVRNRNHVRLEPIRLGDLGHRSPNFPATQMMTLSPFEKRFETVASIAPVPEAANMRTSPDVPMTSFRSARQDRYALRKSSVRWWMSDAI